MTSVTISCLGVATFSATAGWGTGSCSGLPERTDFDLRDLREECKVILLLLFIIMLEFARSLRLLSSYAEEGLVLFLALNEPPGTYFFLG